MSCPNSRWMNPAQVFAQITSASDKGDGNVSPLKERSSSDHHHGRAEHHTGSREIQITETGEVSLAPDKARVSVFCTMTKDTVDDVKNSVNRRVDYILQTLRTHRVKDNDYKMHKMLRRTESSLYKLDVEIVVEFADFAKCENVCNILVEKLDDTVKVSTPEFCISPRKLESLRCQACVCAVKNARNKAMEIAQLFNQTVGSPLVIREESHDEYCGMPCQTSAVANNSEQETFQQRIDAASVTVSVKIFVVFEIKDKVQKKKRK